MIILKPASAVLIGVILLEAVLWLFSPVSMDYRKLVAQSIPG